MSETRTCLFCGRSFSCSPQQSKKQYCNTSCGQAAYAKRKPRKPKVPKAERRNLKKAERLHLIALLAKSGRRKLGAHLGLSPAILMYAAEGVGLSDVSHIAKIMACTLDEAPKRETRKEVTARIRAEMSRAHPFVPQEQTIQPSNWERAPQRYARDEFEY
jgi:hypothetical protein